MTIKFITEKEDLQKAPTFSQVELDQFFITLDGDFCQKSSEDSYTIIARSTGEPCSRWPTYEDEDSEIQKILPKITKITWE